MKENKTNSNTKPYNLDPNVEAALSYLISPITGIVVFLLEKENKFVRFHALQSIFFGVAVFLAWNVAVMSTAILIGVLLTPIVSIGSFILWLILMWKAYNNEEWEIPYLGKLVRDQLNK